MKKVVFILTSRGNYAKLKNLILLFISSTKFKVHIIIGGALVLNKYAKIIQKDLMKNFSYDEVVYFQVEGENNLTMAKSCSIAMNEFSIIFNNIKPDYVFVLADRFETIAIAVAASFLNFKLVHLEGGENSGSIDDKIRHAVSQFSDYHFPCTEQSQNKLIKLGIPKHKSLIAGSTSFDELLKLDLDDLSFFDKLKIKEGVGTDIVLKKKNYILVVQHPVTSEYQENLNNINETIKAISSVKMPVIWLWPNMDAGSDGISKGIRIFRETVKPDSIFFAKSFAIEYFGPLLNNCSCIVGNSSTGIREASFLGIPTVNIGSRQNNREQAKNVINTN
ncbi:UDP-N-acetylglucosamine 2-epimerase, partial [Rickettsiales bacterium]|nr:UDP-N-acetylglucosamine 2-epimerase [Rickettsiales bacterium]